MINSTSKIKSGYKSSSLGVIPSDWDVKPLGEVVEYKKGFAFKTEQYKDHGVRIIRVSDTNADGIKNEGLIFIDEKDAIQFSVYCLLEDDVIIQTVGSRPPLYDSMVGKTIIVDKKFSGSLLNQNAVRLRSKNGVNRFLFTLLKTKRYFNFIETLVRGNANQVSITLDDVFSFQLPVPPRSEQYDIAQLLSSWDAAISKTNQLVIQSELRKKWLMQNLLSGKNRLKGFQGKIELKVIGHYLTEVSERNINSKVANVLSVTNSKGFINQADQFDRVVASVDASNYKIVCKGQFAYNPSRVNVGSLDLLRTFEEGILSPMYVVFKTKNTELLPEFLFYHLKSHWFHGHIPMFVQGSVRDSLSFDGLCGIKFFIPSIEEQTAITNVLQIADKEIQLLKKKLEILKKQKKGLMQQLLTGKKRIKI